MSGTENSDNEALFISKNKLHKISEFENKPKKTPEVSDRLYVPNNNKRKSMPDQRKNNNSNNSTPKPIILSNTEINNKRFEKGKDALKYSGQVIREEKLDNTFSKSAKKRKNEI